MSKNRFFRSTALDRKGNKKRELEEKYPLVTNSGYHLDRYATLLDAIKEYIREPYDLSEVEDGVAGGIQNAVAITQAQEALEEKTVRELLRYLKAEKARKRNIVLARPHTFLMGGEYYFQCPVAIVTDPKNRRIETIRYKSGAATGMTKGITGGKPEEFSRLEKFYDLYADIQYVRQNIPSLCPELADGRIYHIQADYYFLKKTTDKKEDFDPDFFSTRGNSVVGISEVVSYGEDTVTELDQLYEKYIAAATTVGFACEKDDCRYCNYKALCNFNRANVKLETKAAKASAPGTPSPAQQAVLDAAADSLGMNEKRFLKVNAGAGTGKTFTMVHLVLRLLKKGYDSSQILITSFTNAGVREIRERIVAAAAAEGIFLSEEALSCFTFDSFYYDCIAKYYQKLGFSKMPKLLQADREKQYIEEILEENPLSDVDYSRMDVDMESGQSTPWVINLAAKAIQLIRTYRIDPVYEDSITELMGYLADAGMAASLSEDTVSALLDVYLFLEERLVEEGFITYSHLAALMENLYQKIPTLYADMGYRFLITDEFQDSDEYQVETLKRLSETDTFETLVVVGDDDQSIYGFRNTTPEYILHLDRYLGQEVQEFFLLDNRRSTKRILNLANDIVAKNEHRTMKSLYPVREEGDEIVLKGFHSKAKEREWIVSEIERLILEEGVSPEAICVIDRKRAGLLDIGTRLTEKGIPWVSRVGQNLLLNSRVKAALALCDAFYDPEVSANYFTYLIAKYNGALEEQPQGIIQAEMNQLQELFDSMYLLDFEEQRKCFHELLEALLDVEEDEIYSYFLELLYANEDLEEELAYSRIFKKYGNVMEKKLDQRYAGVTLVTSHSSKGLEWPICFHTVSDYDTARLHRGERSQMELEEARRLLFVSVTRARDRLYLSGTYIAYGSEKTGYVYNQFLEELHDLMELPYDPVDHEKEERKRKREAEAALKKQTRRKKQTAFLGNLNGQMAFA